ncbi:RNA-binding (RRM/RBD/RNP motifs) family protein [Striga asiatica]|uniref:RNA-binding (RRM/RBD/RNP motifs) family protein n=1 Tax=Striga asiatica TaxID=4170 RepID=A0A5A7PJE4_STRAF|nr:RNA-binding (RRM/RBD/RNP motifs) family protein [Striga asiatica]
MLLPLDHRSYISDAAIGPPPREHVLAADLFMKPNCETYGDVKRAVRENRKLLRTARIIFMRIRGKIKSSTPFENHKYFLTRVPMNWCMNARSKCLKPYLYLRKSKSTQ